VAKFTRSKKKPVVFKRIIFGTAQIDVGGKITCEVLRGAGCVLKVLSPKGSELTVRRFGAFH
jgi:hypothetical protein